MFLGTNLYSQLGKLFFNLHQRGQQAEGHGQGLVAEELPGDALDEDDRQEDAHGGQGGRNHGGGHLGRRPGADLAHLLAGLAVLSFGGRAVAQVAADDVEVIIAIAIARGNT